jgi:hypothetical protein
MWLNFPAYSYHRLFQGNQIPIDIKEDVILGSFGSGGLKRIRTLMPKLHAGEFDRTLACDLTYDPSRYSRPRPLVRRHVTFHVFESTAHLVTLVDTLKERFPNLE